MEVERKATKTACWTNVVTVLQTLPRKAFHKHFKDENRIFFGVVSKTGFLAKKFK